MEAKSVRIITSLSLIIGVMALAISLIGVAFTGFYPGIIVLSLLTLISAGSKFYAKKAKNVNIILTIINLVSIPIVLWMTFVITIDRIVPNW